MSYLADAHDAEDLAQSALIHILHSAENFRGESSLEAWADRIAIRFALKAFKKRRRRTELFESLQPAPVPRLRGSDELLADLQAKRRLSALLRELSKPQAVAMILHYVHGYKIEEVAVITDVPVNTVRGRLRSGRKKMKQKILEDPILRRIAEGAAS